MKFVKLTLTQDGKNYSYNALHESMNVLANFLSEDFSCFSSGAKCFRDWILSDKEDPNSGFTYAISGNTTFLEELENDDICLTDALGSRRERKNPPVEIMIPKQQFIKLLDDWEEKVCKHKPKEVIIKHENDQFVIETSN